MKPDKLVSLEPTRASSAITALLQSDPGWKPPIADAPASHKAGPMLGQGWKSQWERVNRRLEDLREVYGDGVTGGTDVGIDRVQSFFEAVHHLKDWLGNDPSVNVTKFDGDTLINGCLALRLCADLANGAKHLKLDPSRKPRTGDHATAVTQNDAAINLGTGKAAYHFRVESAGNVYDVKQIAEDAVDAWRQFLSGRSLL